MARYIDADKLHYSRVRIAHPDGTIGGYNAVVMSAEIKDAPTADVVEVVRCKDCKKSRETEDEKFLFCMHFADTVDTQAYCSYGEKKEDG